MKLWAMWTYFLTNHCACACLTLFYHHWNAVGGQKKSLMLSCYENKGLPKLLNNKLGYLLTVMCIYIYSFSPVLHCLLPSSCAVITPCIKHLPSKETAVDFYNALHYKKPTIFLGQIPMNYLVLLLCIKILAHF